MRVKPLEEIVGGFLGADPGELDTLATSFSSWSSTLDASRRALNGQVHTAPWRGEHADEFRAEWDRRYSPILISVVESLRHACSVLTANAAQQRWASAAGGGVSAMPTVPVGTGGPGVGLRHIAGTVWNRLGSGLMIAGWAAAIVRRRILHNVSTLSLDKLARSANLGREARFLRIAKYVPFVGTVVSLGYVGLDIYHEVQARSSGNDPATIHYAAQGIRDALTALPVVGDGIAAAEFLQSVLPARVQQDVLVSSLGGPIAGAALGLYQDDSTIHRGLQPIVETVQRAAGPISRVIQSNVFYPLAMQVFE